MPDMTEFDQAQPKRKQRLIDDVILAELQESDPDKYEALLEALTNKAYSSRTIERVVRGWGYELSDTSIKDWRRRNA